MPSSVLQAWQMVSPLITTCLALLTPLAGTLHAWAPRLYSHYKTKLSQLYKATPNLQQTFHNSIWPAATFNLGPQTVTVQHRDIANLAFGWCSVTAFGEFDPKHSGHLILWDMKLVIEFPPGATILIPSAVLQHSNVALQEGDYRMSLTQYAAGGLFRWVEQGFQTSAQFKAADKKGKQCYDQESKNRWKKGLELFSTLSELRQT